MPIDRRQVALLWTVGVTALLLAPVPALFGELAPDELGRFPADKLAHAVLFVPLAWAWLDATDAARRISAKGVVVLVALLAWGGALELLQEVTGWRRAEWADLAADAVGLALGAVVPRWLRFRAARAEARRAAR
jgi:VanZ family protein